MSESITKDLRLYPKGSKHLVVNLQETRTAEILDAMLDGKEDVKIPINNINISCKDIKIIDLQFLYPRVLVIFTVEKDAKTEAIPVVEEVKPIPKVNDIESASKPSPILHT